MVKKFAWFKGASPVEQAADGLYRAIIAQARQPRFYQSLEVPDTVDGRFDMVALHTFLVLRRLKREGRDAAELAQALYDLMFADMDQNLREMGIGDMGIGKRIKAMAQMFSGRIAAYDAGLDGDAGGGLEEALRRNLYRKTEAGEGAVAAFATYMRRQDQHLTGQAFAELGDGSVDFAAPPEEP